MKALIDITNRNVKLMLRESLEGHQILHLTSSGYRQLSVSYMLEC